MTDFCNFFTTSRFSYSHIVDSAGLNSTRSLPNPNVLWYFNSDRKKTENNIQLKMQTHKKVMILSC